MAVGLQALADGKGDAFVSAGSTGALVMGATFIVKRIKGVKRPAIGSVLPSNDKPFLLLDCGANADCTAEHLKQFAQMGAIYSEKFVKVQSPRVALANIGTEDSKGDRLRHEAFDLLKETKGVNFIGNVETRDVPYGCCDVLVADGFTGNIILKLYEGVAGAMMANIKSIFKKELDNHARRHDGQGRTARAQGENGLFRVRRRAAARSQRRCYQGARLVRRKGYPQCHKAGQDLREKNIVGTIAQSVKEAADAE